jgi:hypothetical protein
MVLLEHFLVMKMGEKLVVRVPEYMADAATRIIHVS